MSAVRLAAQTRQAFITTLYTILNDGYLRVYDGTLPTTPDTPTSDTLLFEYALGELSAPSGDTLELIIDNTSVQAAGIATRYLLVDSEDAPVLDGPVDLQSNPNAPIGSLLLPVRTLAVNMWIAGSLTISATMVAV